MKERIKWSEVAKSEGQKSIETVITAAIEKMEKEGQILGEGRTSTVTFNKDRPSLCLKELSNKNISGNRTNEEMRLLDLACKKKFPVPRPFCSLENNAGNDHLFMETINGFSLEDLVKKDLYDELPESFDFKKFFDKLRQVVKDMHSAKIYHRDLHYGNVMVDKNGEPVIIDFGDAIEHHFSSEDPYRYINSKGELIILPEDEIKVSESYRIVGLYLKKEGYFKGKEATS